MGCNGGNLAAVWQYLASTGTTSDQCFPYASGNGTAPECITQCADGSPLKMYQAKSAYSVSGIFPFGRVAKIQTEIMNHGPVETGFQVYQDFINYKSGVYQHTSGNLLGGHAVKIIGWGVDNNTPYWVIK
jgi:cathepsin B